MSHVPRSLQLCWASTIQSVVLTADVFQKKKNSYVRFNIGIINTRSGVAHTAHHVLSDTSGVLLLLCFVSSSPHSSSVCALLPSHKQKRSKYILDDMYVSNIIFSFVLRFVYQKSKSSYNYQPRVFFCITILRSICRSPLRQIGQNGTEPTTANQ